MDILGHPFVDVDARGVAIISKVQGTGGVINLATAKEQLLYEVTDPHQYVTPDVIADFTTVHLKQDGMNRVSLYGGGGKQKTATLKVSVGYKAGFVGEGEISYADLHAVERAQLAGESIRKRIQSQFVDLRIDLIGCTPVHSPSFRINSAP